MKKKNTIVLVAIIILVSVFTFLSLSGKLDFTNENNGCDKVSKKIVQGSSLSPLILPDTEVTLKEGYYQCHEVEREDVVAFRYAGDPNPLIKIVKGIPGDKWELKKEGNNFLIIVNEKPLENSKEEQYQIPNGQERMLALYANDYPVIPLDTYLILGNGINGTIDSTRFGLVGRRDIIGKVVY